MISPTSEAELSDAIRNAKNPLRIVGGGTRQTLGNSVHSDASVSTGGLTGITLLEPEALTLVVRAGTPLSHVQAALDAQGQQLPFEPMDHSALLGSTGDTTIGGVVACNISGSSRISAGACRDSLIGVRLVDGCGTIIKNGGRVMKNVTGYDLVKLMAGSYGTLGVMTELSFKLLPKPDHSATVILRGLDEPEGIEALAKALGSPNDVTGAAYVDGRALIRIEGFEKSVGYRAEALKKLFSPIEISVETDTQKNAGLWASIGNAVYISQYAGNIWRLSVKPTDGPKVVARIRAAGHTVQAQYDWGGGLIYIASQADVNVRALMGTIQGHATLIRGDIQGVPRMHPQLTPIANIESGLRAKFDPRGILNTGIMG